ncbi:hypothetical protein J6590_050806 [Homalodisca vitripennis]|nr:hypothetical protein J6590_050806 [Homalodisca vitripennis]
MTGRRARPRQESERAAVGSRRQSENKRPFFVTPVQVGHANEKEEEEDGKKYVKTCLKMKGPFTFNPVARCFFLGPVQSPAAGRRIQIVFTTIFLPVFVSESGNGRG